MTTPENEDLMVMLWDEPRDDMFAPDGIGVTANKVWYALHWAAKNGTSVSERNVNPYDLLHLSRTSFCVAIAEGLEAYEKRQEQADD